MKIVNDYKKWREENPDPDYRRDEIMEFIPDRDAIWDLLEDLSDHPRFINDVAEEAHQNSRIKGFYDGPTNIAEKIALIHSEASEALECDRKDMYCKSSAIPMWMDDENFKSWFRKNVKDTFEDELADIAIRVFDLAAFKGIDLESHILGKMRYNSLREQRHGKNY